MIRSDARVALPEAQKAQQQPRRGDEIKCPAPAEVSADQSADHITKGAANGNRGVENRHDPTPCFDRKKIGQDCWCSRAIPAFANSNANASRKENRERRRQT